MRESVSAILDRIGFSYMSAMMRYSVFCSLEQALIENSDLEDKRFQPLREMLLLALTLCGFVRFFRVKVGTTAE